MSRAGHGGVGCDGDCFEDPLNLSLRDSGDEGLKTRCCRFFSLLEQAGHGGVGCDGDCFEDPLNLSLRDSGDEGLRLKAHDHQR